MTNDAGLRSAPVNVGRSPELRRDFDAGATHPRVLALVSPTCPVCLDGITLVLDGLRATPDDAVIGLHIAWLPVLEADSLEHATAAATALGTDPRVRHYWDAGREISRSAHAALDLGRHDRKVAWDLYLFYRAGVRWQRHMPTPQTWLHQLRIAGQPSLDAESLGAALVTVSR